MKMKYLLIGCILFFLICIIFFFFSKNKKIAESDIDIQSFSFSYSNGSSYNSDILYELNCLNGGCEALKKGIGVSNEDATLVKVDFDMKKKLEVFLMEYQVDQWNGFHESNDYVLDGDSFSLRVQMKNQEVIEASGYMKWPKNYLEFRSKVDELFSDIEE